MILLNSVSGRADIGNERIVTEGTHPDPFSTDALPRGISHVNIVKFQSTSKTWGSSLGPTSAVINKQNRNISIENSPCITNRSSANSFIPLFTETLISIELGTSPNNRNETGLSP